ncbi:slipin family protein [Dinghuibacter silviterrae]|uniref:SPFH domain/Band 7 family protein n=1 Tax=Dinghuibacter silviterrae TaxID=1539049 RepID=A0A4R8DEN7_9BACT|nr:slipin family protein [Dinghuibacter silviterrae]TDW96023.1 SPFH domain/Band 7 family protein [Dinghuibacter silviterrae]
MKRVNINAYQVGLLFRKGTYQRMLTRGGYWLWSDMDLYVCERTQPLTAPVELNILLEDLELKEALHVVEVRENEIVLLYANSLLKEVLTPGRYAFWKSPVRYDFVRIDLGKVEITEPIDRMTLLSKQVAPYVRSIVLENSERGVLFIDGRYDKMLDSGVYYWWKNNTSIHVGKVDVRQQQLEINGQEILTRDKAALRINAWAQYRVVDVEKALLANKEYDKQLYIAFQLALREYVGGLGFDELLEKRETLAPAILASVRDTVEKLGVAVLNFGIRDIILPGDVKDIMNQVLVAEKKAQANVILRREETASTRSLLNTARLLEDSPMLYKLKELEYVEKIAEKVGSISVNGTGVLVDQLRQIFASK